MKTLENIRDLVWACITIVIFFIGLVYGYYVKEIETKAEAKRKKLIQDSVKEYIEQKEKT